MFHVYDLQPVPMTRNRYTTDNAPSNQPPDVPARSSVPPLKQSQACIRTVSVPESPCTTTAPEHSFGANVQSVKNQEVKPSVVTNLRNLKKKFQKKRSTSQEFMYAEVNLEAADSGNTEYQEITWETARMTDEQLPHEYLPPPPFAPGY